jgi:hypothetical protein
VPKAAAATHFLFIASSSFSRLVVSRYTET